MYKRILVAYDGSENAKRALRAAVELARLGGAELTAISVRESLPYFAATVGEVEEAQEHVDQFFHRITKEAKDMAGLAGVELETEVRPGHEVETEDQAGAEPDERVEEKAVAGERRERERQEDPAHEVRGSQRQPDKARDDGEPPEERQRQEPRAADPSGEPLKPGDLAHRPRMIPCRSRPLPA